jgi:arabinofuranan 3-O-arabinosyltransferase
MRALTPISTKEDRELILATLILGMLAFAVGAADYFATLNWTATIPRDATTLAVGRDFLDFWVNGRAAWGADPGRLYDTHKLASALVPIVGANYLGQTWAYPPSILLLAAPFGRLPYFPALLCWTALGVCSFIWSVSRFIPDRRAAIAVVLSPAAMFGLMSGQISFFCASIALMGLSQLDRRPLLSGFLAGLLSVKPQYFVLFPLLFASSGRWRALLAASCTLVLIGVATSVVWGPHIWLAYLQHGIPSGGLVLSDPNMVVAPFMPTLFMNLRVAGLGLAPAMAAQTVLALASGAALVWMCRARKPSDAMMAAVFLACSACAVPYLLSYDTLALSAAAMALVSAGKLDAVGRRLAQLVYWLPLIQIGLGIHRIPGPALIIPVFACYVFVRAISETKSTVHASSQTAPS